MIAFVHGLRNLIDAIAPTAVARTRGPAPVGHGVIRPPLRDLPAKAVVRPRGCEIVYVRDAIRYAEGECLIRCVAPGGGGGGRIGDGADRDLLAIQELARGAPI